MNCFYSSNGDYNCNTNIVEHMANSRCTEPNVSNRMESALDMCSSAKQYNNVCYNNGKVLRCPKIAGHPAGTFGYYCRSGNNFTENYYCPPDYARSDPTVSHATALRDKTALNNNGLHVDMPQAPSDPNAVYPNATDGAAPLSNVAATAVSNIVRNYKGMFDTGNISSVYQRPFSWG